MSQSTTLARPYARALFLLAKQEGALNAYSAQLAFSAHAAALPEVADLLGDPRIGADALLNLLSHPESSEGMRNFLSVLAENARLPLLPEILALFEALRAESEHVVKARITSATPLTPDALRTLTEALKKRFGSDVDVQTGVDAALIGGAIIDTGDVVIDGSVRNKLSRLNASLVN